MKLTDTVILQAVANAGYRFKHWGDGVVTPNRKLTVEKALNIHAIFEVEAPTPTQYTISTNILPNSICGTVSGGGTVNPGTQVTLTATPNDGYRFVGWRKGYITISTNNSYTFNATESATYTAVFEQQAIDPTITITVEAGQGGTVSGGGTVNSGTQVTLTATPNDGYHFVGWKKGNTTISTNNPYTFNATESATYTAVFEQDQPQQYIINVNTTPSEGGNVTGSGKYYHNEQVTLIATPKEGYSFVNWKKGNTVIQNAGATYTFTATEDATYTAVFELTSTTKHTITVSTVTVNNEDGGYIEVTGKPNTGTNVIKVSDGVYEVNDGGFIVLTVHCNPGYELLRWRTSNDNHNPKTINNITEDATYTAEIIHTKHTITTVVSPNDGGIVSISGGIVSDGKYDYGSKPTLTATPNTGYHFVKWNEDDNTDNPRQITVTGNATYTAVFDENPPDEYTIDATIDPPEAESDGCKVKNTGQYSEGAPVELKAVSDNGWLFDYWEVTKGQFTEEPKSISNPLEFEAKENTSYIAHFYQGQTELEKVEFEVRITQGHEIDEESIGEISDGTELISGGINNLQYTRGDSISLTATPKNSEEYEFDGWYLYDQDQYILITENTTYELFVSGAMHGKIIAANFEKIE